MARSDGWHFRFFGRPKLLSTSGREIALPQKAFILALHLILDRPGRSADRTAIGEFLWPDASPEVQQANTRSFLRRIRKAQGSPGPFRIDERMIGLRSVQCDYDDLVRTVAHGSPEQAARAIVDCNKRLLAGAERGDVAFELWLRTRQAAIQSMVVNRAKDILSKQGLRADPDLEFALARFVLALDDQDRAAAAVVTSRDRRSVRETSKAPRPAPQRLIVEPTAQQRQLRPARPSSKFPLLRVTAGRDVSPAQADANDIFADALFAELWLPRNLRIAVGSRKFDDLHAGYDRDTYLLTTRVSDNASPRLTAHLTHAMSGLMLWAESFLFLAESVEKLARRVAIAVYDKITDHIVEIFDQEPAQEQTTFALFLRGDRALQKFDLPHVRRARRLFKTASQLDTSYSSAYAGIARSFRMEWILLAGADRRLLEDAEAAASHALSLAPESAICLRDAGMVSLYLRRFDTALEQLDLAQRLNPADSELTFDYCDALISLGQAAEAIRILQESKCQLVRTADARRWIAATGYYALGKYRDALNELSKMRAPESAQRLQAACHAMEGDVGTAQQFMRRFLEENPGFSMKNWLSVSPFRRVEDQSHFAEGVMKAGFP